MGLRDYLTFTDSDTEPTETDDDGHSARRDSSRVTSLLGQSDVTDPMDFLDSGVRSNRETDDDITSEKRYEDEESDTAADNIDVRGLFRQPTVNLLRYHARENPYGRTITRLPIIHAFKNGFTIDGDNTEPSQGVGSIDAFLTEHVETLRQTAIMARRDGLVVLMHQTADEADSVAEPLDTGPTSDATFEGLKLWTLDHLSDDISSSDVEDHTDYDNDQIYVTDGDDHGGVAFVNDITSPDHGTILGYGIQPREDSPDERESYFVHASRCHHVTWDSYVDGDLGNEISGRQVGESVLTPIFQPLETSMMAIWAQKNILFRYSAPLHAIEPPETWGQDEYEQFSNEELQNLSMLSDALLPPGASLTVAEGVSEFDPEPYTDSVVKAMCAGTVFTQSILQGTQSGTVSGSETDLKAYFNNIQTEIRSQYLEPLMHDIVTRISRYDQRTIPPIAANDAWEVDWGPMFKVTDVEKAEGAVSLITAATNGIKNYVLTPDEARALVAEEWATFDIDVDLDALTEDQWDNLDRINIREAGQGPRDDEPVGGEGSTRENPRIQNGGGQPQGQTRESSQPARDAIDREALVERIDEELTGDETAATEIVADILEE